MQFIVIYGIRFVCGGHRGLEGGQASCQERCPSEEQSPILASLPLPGSLANGSCLDEAHATTQYPPYHLSPTSNPD